MKIDNRYKYKHTRKHTYHEKAIALPYQNTITHKILLCLHTMLLISILLYSGLIRDAFSDSLTLGQFRASHVISNSYSPTTFSSQESIRLRYAPLQLSGGSNLLLVAPTNWKILQDRIARTVQINHARYERIFGKIPKFSAVIRLMPEKEFFQLTNAPKWTNAMFYKGEVIIPIKPNKLDLEDLYRSVNHEYTHAIVNSLSRGRCPGWIDEGLAQLAEGKINPSLDKALFEWLLAHKPIPLSIMQGGFTRFKVKMVAPAYAQSLHAVRYLLESHSYSSLRKYFLYLRNGIDKDEAFKKAFGISERKFEEKLSKRLSHFRTSMLMREF